MIGGRQIGRPRCDIRAHPADGSALAGEDEMIEEIHVAYPGRGLSQAPRWKRQSGEDA